MKQSEQKIQHEAFMVYATENVLFAQMWRQNYHLCIYFRILYRI